MLAGPGGHGGGGLVAARHLANRGYLVRVVLSAPDRLNPVPAHQGDIVHRISVVFADQPPPADVVIDALIGYSLRGNPTGAAAELIEWANNPAAPILALDTPSGLDITTGTPGNPCVWAAAPLTRALPKTGLLDATEVGELYLANISVPPLVYERMGIHWPALFRESSVVRLNP